MVPSSRGGGGGGGGGGVRVPRDGGWAAEPARPLGRVRRRLAWRRPRLPFPSWRLMAPGGMPAVRRSSHGPQLRRDIEDIYPTSSNQLRPAAFDRRPRRCSTRAGCGDRPQPERTFSYCGFCLPSASKQKSRIESRPPLSSTYPSPLPLLCSLSALSPDLCRLRKNFRRPVELDLSGCPWDGVGPWTAGDLPARCSQFPAYPSRAQCRSDGSGDVGRGASRPDLGWFAFAPPVARRTSAWGRNAVGRPGRPGLWSAPRPVPPSSFVVDEGPMRSDPKSSDTAPPDFF